MGHQGRAKGLGRVEDTIGAEVHQRETFKHRSSFGKGVLGGTEQGKQFVEASTASASTEAEVSI